MHYYFLARMSSHILFYVVNFLQSTSVQLSFLLSLSYMRTHSNMKGEDIHSFIDLVHILSFLQKLKMAYKNHTFDFNSKTITLRYPGVKGDWLAQSHLVNFYSWVDLNLDCSSPNPTPISTPVWFPWFFSASCHEILFLKIKLCPSSLANLPYIEEIFLTSNQ